MLSEVEASLFCMVIRSFTSVQDDKSAKKQTWVNYYIIALFFEILHYVQDDNWPKSDKYG